MQTTLNIITLLFISNISIAQICKTEAEIPSTTPNSRFTDNGDNTITDNGTSLMWQKCQLGLSDSSCTSGSTGVYNWQESLTQAQNSNVAGYNDWRLPNHKELLSIVEEKCFNPTINTNYFPNTSSSSFWSASPPVNDPDHAWIVYFDTGYSGIEYRFNYRYVRLVRFGH